MKMQGRAAGTQQTRSEQTFSSFAYLKALQKSLENKLNHTLFEGRVQLQKTQQNTAGHLQQNNRDCATRKYHFFVGCDAASILKISSMPSIPTITQQMICMLNFSVFIDVCTYKETIP